MPTHSPASRRRGPRAAAALALLTVLAAGCATPPRPDPGIACNLYSRAVPLPGGSPQPAPLPPGTAGSGSIPAATPALAPDLLLRRQITQNFADRQAVKRDAAARRPPPVARPPGVAPLPPPPPAPPVYSVLVLSAGGQTGAYGGGFLIGWGARADLQPDRSEIDMVTGVSTGAMMATYAYLGASSDPAVRARYDALLETQYTTLRDDDVFRKRSVLELLWANSVYDSQPLWDRIGGLITDALLDDVVAEAARSRRMLFVGAVNADSGSFEYFDLVAIASDRSHDRRGCYSAAILASAAIPGAFKPVFINGKMYIDGGARRHVFFVNQVGAALPGATKQLFGIMHADLGVGAQTTRNHVIGVVSRTASLAMDELVLDAAYQVDAEASRLGFVTRWTSAANVSCPGGGGMFDPAVGRCLWDTGLARARDQAQPWKPFAQIRSP